MPGLFNTLSMASESLFVARQGVDTTGHNIANAQTDGYSRQRVNAQPRDPTYQRGVIKGNGVYARDIGRSHNKWIEKQLNVSSHKFGQSQGRKDALKNLELIFSPEMASSVNEEANGFFNALQELSNNPDELAARSNVVESAKNLVGTFRRIDRSLRANRANLNSEIQGLAKSTSEKLERIGELNVQIGSSEVGLMTKANDLRDERDRIVRELSELFEVNYYEDESGMLTVRGPNDSLLVDGKITARIDVGANAEEPDKLKFVVIDGVNKNVYDVTDNVGQGRLSGLLQVRDEIIDGLLEHNNNMAMTFTQRVNDVHRQGYGIQDYRESTGRDFFQINDDIGFAARSMDIADSIYESLDAISAASTPNAPGDNVIVNDLVRLKDTKVFAEENATMSEYYSNYVGQFGLEVVRADHLAQSDEIVNNDFKSKRESISGVSLDEEATNLMKWQTQFTASSKIVTTADEMLETVLGLKR